MQCDHSLTMRFIRVLVILTYVSVTSLRGELSSTLYTRFQPQNATDPDVCEMWRHLARRARLECAVGCSQRPGCFGFGSRVDQLGTECQLLLDAGLGVCNDSDPVVYQSPGSGYSYNRVETLDAADACASSPCYHGGTCTNSGAGFTCTCLPGVWSGLICETPLVFACYVCQSGSDAACVEGALAADEQRALAPQMAPCNGYCYISRVPGTSDLSRGCYTYVSFGAHSYPAVDWGSPGHALCVLDPPDVATSPEYCLCESSLCNSGSYSSLGGGYIEALALPLELTYTCYCPACPTPEVVCWRDNGAYFDCDCPNCQCI